MRDVGSNPAESLPPGVTGLVFALENPRRVRTPTLIEPPAFWALPNHGYDDAGAREMQEFVRSLCARVGRADFRPQIGLTEAVPPSQLN